MSSKKIESSKAPEPVGLYPHAAKWKSVIFIWSWTKRKRNQKIPGVELDDQGNILSYDIEEQCRSVFNNVRTIVEESGSSWDKVVDVTVFLTNMKNDFKTYNRISLNILQTISLVDYG